MECKDVIDLINHDSIIRLVINNDKQIMIHSNYYYRLGLDLVINNVIEKNITYREF